MQMRSDRHVNKVSQGLVTGIAQLTGNHGVQSVGDGLVVTVIEKVGAGADHVHVVAGLLRFLLID